MEIFTIMCDKPTSHPDSLLQSTQHIRVECLLHRRPCAEHCVEYNNTQDPNPTVKDFRTCEGRKHSHTNNETQRKVWSAVKAIKEGARKNGMMFLKKESDLATVTLGCPPCKTNLWVWSERFGWIWKWREDIESIHCRWSKPGQELKHKGKESCSGNWCGPSEPQKNVMEKDFS